ncbi:putative glyoxalase/bleomycin resistance protein/dioxygenase [Rhodococcus sp. MTM3W5.2]|nr:putative glyoxalase/bleomycin resistance protein/dioxygenase [Rhodococcus sp. MTM3W5.2]
MSTQTTNTTTIWPTLSYANARGAIAFLVKAFGFIETAVYGEGERVDHAQLDWPGGGGVMLGSQRPDSAVGTCRRGSARCTSSSRIPTRCTGVPSTPGPPS